MKLKFISHASMVVSTEDSVIWSDPWLFGKAFNDSWSLFPEAYFDQEWLDSIDFIWISHEHPDHFHIPTLRSFPDEFKQNVTILFQQNNSDKLPNALKKFGYKNIIRLPHNKFVPLTSKTTVWNYQVGQMDSILAICQAGKTILNLNDAEVNDYDVKIIKKKLGKIDIILNQFSLAGYNGYYDFNKHLPALSQGILKKVYHTHVQLRASVTIPFASMIYFSTADNKYINPYANTPHAVYDYFKKNNKENEMIIMYPGDEYVYQQFYDNQLAVNKYISKFKEIDNMPYVTPVVFSIEKLIESFKRLHQVIHQRYYKFILSLFLKPIYIFVPDLQATFAFDLVKGQFYQTYRDDYHLEIYSQPLYFAMQFDWGFQTLGVSARHKVLGEYANYKRHRLLFALNNAEIWLKLHLLFTFRNFKWVITRFNGLLRQIKHRYASQSE